MFETRIYFSYFNNTQLNEVIELTNKILDGYTIYKAIGYWKGYNEPSRIIEIIHNRIDIPKTNIKYLANKIKEICHQENVLITSKSLNMEFV